MRIWRSRPHEIAQGFIVRRGDVDGRQFARTMQPSQGVAVPPIRLDPVAAAFRHARGIDHDTVFPLGREIAVEAKSARAGFVHEAQSARRCPQRPDDLGHRLQVAGDHPVVPHFAGSPLVGERNIDRFFVDIHPHEHATFRHDLPPLYVALRGTLIGDA